jgi:hypothetical protein
MLCHAPTLFSIEPAPICVGLEYLVVSVALIPLSLGDQAFEWCSHGPRGRRYSTKTHGENDRL